MLYLCYIHVHRGLLCACAVFFGILFIWVSRSLFIWVFVFYLLGFLFIGVLQYFMFLFMVFMADVACKRGHPDIPARCPLHAGFSPSTHPLCRFARVPPLSDTLDVEIFYSLYVGLVSTRNYYVFRPSTHTATRGERSGS